MAQIFYMQSPRGLCYISVIGKDSLNSKVRQLINNWQVSRSSKPLAQTADAITKYSRRTVNEKLYQEFDKYPPTQTVHLDNWKIETLMTFSDANEEGIKAALIDYVAKFDSIKGGLNTFEGISKAMSWAKAYPARKEKAKMTAKPKAPVAVPPTPKPGSLNALFSTARSRVKPTSMAALSPRRGAMAAQQAQPEQAPERPKSRKKHWTDAGSEGKALHLVMRNTAAYLITEPNGNQHQIRNLRGYIRGNFLHRGKEWCERFYRFRGLEGYRFDKIEDIDPRLPYKEYV